MKLEMTVEAAIVTANWRKNNPDMPDRKADGTNTAHRVSAIEISAPPTSSIVLWRVASGGDIPGSDFALDVLDDDDRVIDNNPDGQHQAKQ